MFDAGETVMLAPVPIGVPPQVPANHSIDPPVPASAPPFTVRVVESPLHIVAVPVIPVGGDHKLVTVATLLPLA